MKKLKLENYSVTNLSVKEKVETIGGDEFMSDLGYLIGSAVGSVVDFFARAEFRAPGYVHSQYGI